MKNKRINEVYRTKEGYLITIIEDFGWNNCTIQFENGLIIKNKNYGDIKKGKIKNPYHPSVSGVGYIGKGAYNVSINGVQTIEYSIWSTMIVRCYNEKRLKNFPTYKTCSVIEEWHNFQVFAEWFEAKHVEKYQLDKDLLVKGNKVYSPETCCFVPSEINLLIKNKKVKNNLYTGVRKNGNKYQAVITLYEKVTPLGTFDTPEEAWGVYKIAKELYNKEVADIWRDKIEDRVYQSIVNWTIEITD